jgi:hypothetical protein
MTRMDTKRYKPWVLRTISDAEWDAMTSAQQEALIVARLKPESPTPPPIAEALRQATGEELLAELERRVKALEKNE